MDSFELAAILIAIAVIAVAVLIAVSVGRKGPRRRGDDGAAMTAGTFWLATHSDGAGGDSSGGDGGGD